MFRSRASDKDKGADTGANREVSVPLVKTQDGKDFDPKRKRSNNNSIVSGLEDGNEEAVQAQESKRRKRRIMKIAVYFMFGIIAIGVFAIWLFHKDAVENLRFGSNFLLSVKLRSLVIKNNEGLEVLYGDMGRRLLATPYDRCWDDDYQDVEDNCLLWRRKAKLHVDKNDNSTSQCYTLTWESLVDDHVTEDCFYLQEYGDNGMRWYGFLTNRTQPWPVSSAYLDDVEYYPEYPVEQNENLIPAWYTSRGTTIYVDSSFPFKISWNVTDKRQFCLMSQLTYTQEQLPASVLKYTICQADTLKEVYSMAQQHRLEEDVEFILDRQSIDMLLPKPVVVVTSKESLRHLETQLRNNLTHCSLIELYDKWETHYGDLEIDPSVSALIQDIIKVAEHQDCRLLLPISTFFSYKSKHFEEGIDKRFFIKDELKLATRMVRWHNEEGAVLDVTNPEAVEWFLVLVKRQIYELKVKALKLLHLSIPGDSAHQDTNMTNLDYTRIFYRDLASMNTSLVLELATGFVPIPVYVPVKMAFYGPPGDACMNTSIPLSLIFGMSGYPLLIADAKWMSSQPLTEMMLMKWLRLAIFFPIMEIPNIDLLDQDNMKDALEKLLRIRNEIIMPHIIEAWNHQPHVPIIRPLWWQFPNVREVETINDQFMVGERLMVAPLLCEQHSNRTLYLPPGKWKVYRNEKTLLGPKLVEVEAVLSIPFFVYMGENDEL